MNKLIIVESPTKAKTIGRLVGKEYQILATMGHIRDLPKSKFGVEVKKKGKQYQFFPEYVNSRDKTKTIAQLKNAVEKVSEVYLATDPDREGEAIAWHVIESLKSKIKDKKINFKKIHFHEITKPAVEEALRTPHGIDMDLVNAQQARRVLDRLVGYSLSPLLWRKIRRGLSAGRVQSVAVRLIVEREKEINQFKKEKYCRICAEVNNFIAQLIKVDQKTIEVKEKKSLFSGTNIVTKTIFTDLKEAEKIVLDLAPLFKVAKVEKKEVRRYPFPPFTTSTLQQDASRRFGWSSKQTMRVAQTLFEKGEITYHRTDSTALAGQAVEQIRKFVGQEYGQEYLPEKSVFYKTRSKLAQEAHEAIRPTKISSKLKVQNSKLDGSEAKLYRLIWQRAISCQMKPAVIAQTKLELENGRYTFSANGSHVVFDGFSKVYPISFSENTLPKLEEGQQLKTENFGITQHETLPPPRYNEATLIAALEKNGIGRPSTYAPIISTIQQRLYVEKEEKKFLPTPVGNTTNDFLVEHFETVLSLPFTAEMENSLDEIALGKEKWQPVLSKFWGPFEKRLNLTEKEAKRVQVPAEKLGRKCPKCKKADLVIRTGRFGKFIACSAFPECDYKESFREKVDFKCTACGKEVVIKSTKKGAKFFSCSTWPKCNWSSWKKPK